MNLQKIVWRFRAKETHQGFHASTCGPLDDTNKFNTLAAYKDEARTAHPIPLKFLPWA